MKILTVVLNLNKGGTQRAAQNFCEAYKVLGHDSRMLALYDAGPRMAELLEENIFVWIGKTDLIYKEVEKWQPDLVHLHAHGLAYDDVLRLNAVCGKAKFVETNVFSRPSKYSHILDYSYQLSGWCSYLYAARGGVTTKSTIVPYPVKGRNFYRASKDDQLDFRSKYSIPGDAFLFGRIGQNHFDKWSLYLIDVFKDFVDQTDANARLLVVNAPAEILQYAASKNIKDKLITISRLDGDDELRKCYSSIDLFLHIANQGESFGMVLAESLLCETPVIALNTPWSDNSQAEVLGNNIGGVCANTISGFLTSMKQLYNDRNRLKEFGTRGRLHVLEKYDYIAVAEKSLKTAMLNSLPYQESVLNQIIKANTLNLNYFTILLLSLKIRYQNLHRYANFLLKVQVNYWPRRNLFPKKKTRQLQGI